MSSATIPIIKTLAMADSSSLLTLPSIFTPNTPYSYLSVPQKSIKLQLSCSHSTVFTNSLSLKRNILFSPLVAFVAQTSDWAQQEEGQETQLVVELEEGVNWENQEFDAFESPISDWEGEGEDAAIKASREEIGEGDEDGFSEEGEEEGEVYQESPEELKVFVGNLPYDVDSEGLAQIFEQAGVVEISEVIFNRETNQSRGFGFVTMSTVEEAEKAVEMFNRYVLNGRPLTVNKAAPRGSRPERPPRAFEPSFRIYVGNLPWDVDNARLEQIFSEHGKMVEARVVYDRETGRSHGFAFVTMSSQTEMNEAIAALDGESLNGRAIRVSAAGERPRRSSF